jgi:hypothetical protein
VPSSAIRWIIAARNSRALKTPQNDPAAKCKSLALTNMEKIL